MAEQIKQKLLEQLEKEAERLHNSTRTDLPFLSPVHNLLRTKSKIYYNWSAYPRAQKIHRYGLLGFLVSFIFFSFLQYIYPNLFVPEIKPVLAGSNNVQWTTKSHFTNNSNTTGDVTTQSPAGQLDITTGGDVKMASNEVFGSGADCDVTIVSGSPTIRQIYESAKTEGSLPGVNLNCSGTIINNAGLGHSNYLNPSTNVPNFNSLTINNGTTLTTTAPSGANPGDKLEFKALSLDIQVGGTINANGKGYAGGANGVNGSLASDGYGYKGGIKGSCFWGTAGGGGGYGGSGGRGGQGGPSPCTGGAAGGISYNYNDSVPMTYFGSGGGGGGSCDPGIGGVGGNGGGAIKISTASINIGGNIYADGLSGGSGSGTYNSAGGGGSGGSVYLVTNTSNVNLAKISVKGGNGGSSTIATNHGGGGGGGRVIVESPSIANSPVVSGGTTPGCSVAGSATTPAYQHTPTTNLPYSVSGTLGEGGTGLRFDAGAGAIYNWNSLLASSTSTSATCGTNPDLTNGTLGTGGTQCIFAKYRLFDGTGWTTPISGKDYASTWTPLYNGVAANISSIGSSQRIEIKLKLVGNGTSANPTLSDLTLNYDSLESPLNANTAMYKSNGTTLLNNTSGNDVSAGNGGGFTNETSVKITATGLTCGGEASGQTACSGSSTNRKIQVQAALTSDTGFSSPISSVDGSTTSTTSDGGINYTSTATITGLNVGDSYHLRLRTIDGQGRQSGWANYASDGTAFTVEQTSPTVSGVQVLSSTDDPNYVNASTRVVKVAGTFNDLGGSSGTLKVQFSEDGTTWGAYSGSGSTNTMNNNWGAGSFVTATASGTTQTISNVWAIQTEGANIPLYVRTMDMAGNVSGKQFTSQNDWNGTTQGAATTVSQLDLTAGGDVKLGSTVDLFGDGSDGSFLLNNNILTIRNPDGTYLKNGVTVTLPYTIDNGTGTNHGLGKRIFNFTSFRVIGGGQVTHQQDMASYATKGIDINVTGTKPAGMTWDDSDLGKFVIDGASSKIDVSGKGYAGGPAGNGAYGSGPGGGGGGSVNSCVGGGGGGYGKDPAGSASGGNGGGGNSSNGYGGLSYSSFPDFGSGGGVGDSWCWEGFAGAGGNGGGLVQVKASNISITNNGSISANGSNAELPGYYYGGSGGGSGGGIYIKSPNNIINNGSISANGGIGSSATDVVNNSTGSGGGGGGGGGRIKIESPAVPGGTITAGGGAGGTGGIYAGNGSSGVTISPAYTFVALTPYQPSGTLGSTGNGLRIGSENDPDKFKWLNLHWLGSGLANNGDAFKIGIKVRPADAWGSGSYVNPSDGTDSFYYIETGTSGNIPLSSSFANTKTLEIQLRLEGDGSSTPVLSDLIVDYAPLDQITTDFTSPNPPSTNLSTTPTSLRQGNVDLSWGAGDDGTGSGIQKYRIYRSKDGGAFNHVGYTTGTETTYTDTSFASAGLLDEGKYLYKVSSIDNAGNEGGQSNAFPELTIDQTGPNAPTGFNIKTSTDADAATTWTNQTTFKLNFNVSDPLIGASPGSQAKKVHYRLNAAPDQANHQTFSPDLSCSSSPCAVSDFSVTLSPSDGTHTLYIATEDAAGNVNWANTASYQFKIDQTAGTVSGFTINSSAAYTNNKLLSVSGIFTDVHSSSPSVSGQLQAQFSQNQTDWGKINATNNGVLTTSGNDWTNYITVNAQDTSQTLNNAWYFTGSDSDTKTLYVRVKDAAGNVTSSTISDDIFLDTQIPNAPTDLTLDKTVSRSGNITLTWTAAVDNAPSSGLKRYLILRNKDGGSFTQIDTLNAPATGYTDMSLSSPLAGDEGKYAYRIITEDNALNQSAQSSNSTEVTVDITAPNAPTNQSISPSAWTSQKTFDVTLTLSDANAGSSPGSQAKKVYYKLGSAPTSTGDLNVSVTCASSPCNQTVTLDLTSVLTTDGTYTLYLTPEDTAGNVNWASTATVTIQYDATGPTPPQPSTNFFYNYQDSTATTITVRWNAAIDISGITAYQLLRKLKTETWGQADWTSPEISGTATSYIDNNNGAGLQEGYKYTYKIRVKNSVNLWGDWSNEIEASTRDVVAPTSPIKILANPCNGVNYCTQTSNKGFEIKLTWNPSDDGPGMGVTGYKIYRKTTNESDPLNWTQSDIVGYLDVINPGQPITTEWYDNDLNNTLTYTDNIGSIPNTPIKSISSKKLNEWQNYYYRITSIDAAGNESAIMYSESGDPILQLIPDSFDNNLGFAKTPDVTGPQKPEIPIATAIGVDTIGNDPLTQRVDVSWNQTQDLRNQEANRDPLGGTGSGIKEYRVYRAKADDCFTAIYDYLTPNSTTNILSGTKMEISGLDEYSLYCFKVSAVDNSLNEAPLSDPTQIRTATSQAPSTPTNINIISTKGDSKNNSNIGKQITISFTGSKIKYSSNKITGYEVYRSTTNWGDNLSDWQDSSKSARINHSSIENLNINGWDESPLDIPNYTYSLTDDNLIDATTYFYKIRAIAYKSIDDQFVSSSLSQININLPNIGWDTTPDITKPTAPQDVKVKDIHGDGISLLRNIITWARIPESNSQNQRNSTVDFKEYRIYRCTNPDPVTGDCTQIASKSILGDNYYVDGINQADANQLYYYYVTAIDNASTEFKYSNNIVINSYSNESSYLPPVSINPSIAKPTVSNVSVSNIGVSSATIIWSTDQETDSVVEYQVKGTNNVIGTLKNRTQMTTNHSVQIQALQKGVTYQYRVVSRNSLGNIDDTTANTWNEFQTQDFSISNSSVLTTTTTATIKWNTNIDSDSQIEYKLQKQGVEQEESSQTAGDPSLVKNHQVVIKALKPGRTYTYKIRSVTSDKFVSETEFKTFQTKPYDSSQFTIAPDASRISEQNITSTSAKITWATEVPTASWVEYSNESGKYVLSAGSNDLTKSHVVELMNLTPNILYYYRVKGKDQYDIEYVSQEYSFRALAKPELSSVSVREVTPYTATITWTTNIPTDSGISYGETSNYDKREQSKDLKTSHSLTLTNLLDQATYHFMVEVKDAYGNIAKSEDKVFTTPLDTQGPKISEVKLSPLQGGDSEKRGVIITWMTDKESTSQIEYGAGVTPGKYESKTPLDQTLNLSHTVIISDLEPGTTYHLRLISKDKRENETKSQDYTMITQEKEESILNLILKTLEDTFSWVGKVKDFVGNQFGKIFGK